MNDEQYKALLAAADFFNDTARKLLATEHGLHAETLISAVARMAGSLMFRSFNLPAVPAGSVVLSDLANTEGPKLMNMMLITLQQLGHNISKQNIDTTQASAKLVPLVFLETTDRLTPFYLKYCEVSSMKLQDAAMAAAITTGLLIHDCREVLSIEQGAAIAVYGFVEGTKTMPNLA